VEEAVIAARKTEEEEAEEPWKTIGIQCQGRTLGRLLRKPL
jgi:hypothetical protein